MPKEILNLNDFSVGLIDDTDPRDIPLNALAEANNVSFKRRNEINTLGGLITTTDATKGDLITFDSSTTFGPNTGASALKGHLTAGHGLFTFESDYTMGLDSPASKNASGATDQGDHWLVFVDAITMGISLYNQSTDTWNLISDGSHNSFRNANMTGDRDLCYSKTDELEFSSTTNLNDVIKRSSGAHHGDDFLAANIRPGDYIHVFGATDQGTNNKSNLRVLNVQKDKIVLDHVGLITAESSEAGEVGIVSNLRPVFYYANNAVRISDAGFFLSQNGASPADNQSFQNVWLGYIKRDHFQAGGPGQTVLTTSANGVFDGWDAKKNDLAAPTFLATSGSEAYPTGNGTGFHLRFIGDTSLSTSSFTNVAYQIAVSYIYDGNQESLLFIPTSNNTFTPSGANKKLEFALYANAAYDSRISGARIYARVDGTQDPFFLLIDVDMTKGIRPNLNLNFETDDNVSAWSDNSSATQAKAESIHCTDINLETYEILNGFSNEQEKITISGVGEGYKAAEVTNRRCFVANIRTKMSDNVLKQFRDRIMYTPINKFDTFPRDNFIDVVQGDASEFTALSSFSDRLLAYKRDKLFIINIANPNPSNWFLENTIERAGCEMASALVKTEFGVVWAGKYGLYLYNGQVKNLLENKLKTESWISFYTKGTILGYHNEHRYLIIVKDCIKDNNNAYLYDFKNNAIVKADNSTSVTPTETVITNFINWTNRNNVITTDIPGSHNDILAIEDAHQYGSSDFLISGGGNNFISSSQAPRTTNPGIVVWKDIPKAHANGNFTFTTKDIDFDSPGRIKRIYAIYVTYESDASHTNPVSFATDSSTSFTTLTGNFSSVSTPTILKLVPSSIVQCQSIKLKIQNTAATGTTKGIKINEISIEFRTTTKRLA